MKRYALIKPAVLAGSALFAGFALAGEPAPKAAITPAPSSDLEVSFGVGYTSEDVWRGINRGDDLFDASIGVSGSGSLGGLGDLDLSAGLHLLTRSNGTRSATAGAQELRINMEASKSLGCFDLAVGVTNYSGFGDWSGGEDLLEPYVALSTKLAGLNVGIGVYDDHNDVTGSDDPYIEITASRSVALGGLGLSVEGVVGTWNEFDDTHYGLSICRPIAASDSITVTPHVSAIFGDTSSGDDEFTAGVNLGFGF